MKVTFIADQELGVLNAVFLTVVSNPTKRGRSSSGKAFIKALQTLKLVDPSPVLHVARGITPTGDVGLVVVQLDVEPRMDVRNASLPGAV